MLSDKTFQFLKNLAANNNREWLAEHKPEFQTASEDFAGYITVLIAKVADFDPAVKNVLAADCIFRIYRDIRFSKNKTPYKTHFSAYISPGGRKSNIPGYYLHLDAKESFLAGGSWHPGSPEVFKVRSAMIAENSKFLDIVGKKSFVEAFTDSLTGGEKLRKVPNGFPADHAAAEYLKLKSFTVHTMVDHAYFTDIPKLSKRLREMNPFIEFLRTALK